MDLGEEDRGGLFCQSCLSHGQTKSKGKGSLFICQYYWRTKETERILSSKLN